MRWRLLLLLGLFGPVLQAQPNCNAFYFQGDVAAYEACKYLDTATYGHYQYEEAFQEICDKALAICPHFAYAWREKSTAYVKAGNFVLWLKYMNQAVRFDTLGMLPVRASCRGKFFADHEGAIADVELFERMYPGTLAMAHNGTYSLAMVKALSLRALNRIPEAILTAETYLQAYPELPGMYDRLHLGAMYLQLGDTAQAKSQFERQWQQTPIAEAAYQLARLALTEKQPVVARQYSQQARQLFDAEQRLFDPYHYLSDQLFEADLVALEEDLR